MYVGIYSSMYVYNVYCIYIYVASLQTLDLQKEELIIVCTLYVGQREFPPCHKACGIIVFPCINCTP